MGVEARWGLGVRPDRGQIGHRVYTVKTVPSHHTMYVGGNKTRKTCNQ